jgi:hypothetical protein
VDEGDRVVVDARPGDAAPALVTHSVRLPEIIAQSVGAMGVTSVVALI